MSDSAIPSAPHDAEQDKLNEQRLRFTAARERIDYAAELLAQGGNLGTVCACEELRRALRALLEDQPEGE